MNLIFENCNLNEVSEKINTLNENSEIVLKGEFLGTANICNKNNVKISVIGDNATILGVKKCKVPVKKWKDNVYVAELSEKEPIDRAWLDGEVLILARFPNVSPIEKKQKYTTLDVIEEKFLSAEDPINARVRSLHKNEWGGNGYCLSRENGKMHLRWIGNNNRGSEIKKDAVILENLLEEVDSEREFYYDNLKGLFYVYSESKITEIDLQYSTEETVLNIQNNRADILFQNITFAKTDNSMFKGKWERYLRSDWAFNSEAGVKIDNSKNVSFTNCKFEDMGNTCVKILNNSENILFNDCDFIDSLSNGILICGDKNSTYCTSCWDNDNHITKMESEDKKGAKTNDYPKNITIKNSLFRRLGREDLQSAGVSISLAENVTIDHCTVNDMPRAGINICENAFGGHKIIGNDIYDCVKETGDHGPFNSWGRDRFWSLKKFDTVGKYGKIKKEYAFHDMIKRNEIAENRVMGSRGFGIDLDDGSSGYSIHHNLCIGVGIKLREGFERKVYNNILINAPFDYHCAYAHCGDIVTNNVVFNEEPIREVLENRGSKAIFLNNYYVASEETKTRRFKYTENVTARELINGDFNFPEIEKVPLHFGKPSLEEPLINITETSNKSHKIRGRGVLLSTVDEGIRTSTGAPDLNGIFVEKCSKFSKLYKMGIRSGDLILTADNKIIPIEDALDLIKNAEHIEIVRNQKIQNLF